MRHWRGEAAQKRDEGKRETNPWPNQHDFLLYLNRESGF